MIDWTWTTKPGVEDIIPSSNQKPKKKKKRNYSISECYVCQDRIQYNTRRNGIRNFLSRWREGHVGLGVLRVLHTVSLAKLISLESASALPTAKGSLAN